MDQKKQSYETLGYKRFGYIGILASLVCKASRDLIAKVRQDPTIGGDFKGDGLQNGGVLVIGKGGEVLLSYKQVSPADHVENSEVLKALGLSHPAAEAENKS